MWQICKQSRERGGGSKNGSSLSMQCIEPFGVSSENITVDEREESYIDLSRSEEPEKIQGFL